LDADGGLDGDVELRVTVANSGPRPGRETVQVYVEPAAAVLAADPARPVRWLGGFAVVDVAPGDRATVAVRVPARALQTWDTAAGGWTTPHGTYRLRVGRSVRDLRLDVDVEIGPDHP